jgi:hypothetical protein
MNRHSFDDFNRNELVGSDDMRCQSRRDNVITYNGLCTLLQLVPGLALRAYVEGTGEETSDVGI